jgi:hypothetical protein
LLDKIETKITLSTPSTISRNVNVMSAMKPEEENSASIVTALPWNALGNCSRSASEKI